jgi:hypothetical protein
MIEESAERVRPADVSRFVRDEAVVDIRCATPATEQVSEERWRSKVDPDVRTIHAAQSSCWTAVSLQFSHEPSTEDWRAAEETGLVSFARDGRSAIVWAPVRGIPRLAAMDFVASVEPFTSN